MYIDTFINNCKYEINNEEKNLLCYKIIGNCILIMKKIDDNYTKTNEGRDKIVDIKKAKYRENYLKVLYI